MPSAVRDPFRPTLPVRVCLSSCSGLYPPPQPQHSPQTQACSIRVFLALRKAGFKTFEGKTCSQDQSLKVSELPAEMGVSPAAICACGVVGL